METTQLDDAESTAKRFGELITRLAIEAGYNLDSGGGGRSALARDTGMSASAIGRMLSGRSLPMPSQLESIARAVRTDVRTLLVTAGVISEHSWPHATKPDVLSVTQQSPSLSPEAAADAWGITNPGIRSMLLASIEQAIRLQEASSRKVERGETATRE
ncbi:helix-turn-helix domain-containing protein [Streptomyces sulphureus]|uniref:helix-turn-helix domain-containing protein n=1 Tax=Streptomyces sulphureus TaxID=47758 RepID=UPI00035C35C5|nr:helix-turn-helix transcriptional regulator [Streptomyces sulphureus]